MSSSTEGRGKEYERNVQTRKRIAIRVVYTIQTGSTHAKVTHREKGRERVEIYGYNKQKIFLSNLGILCRYPADECI